MTLTTAMTIGFIAGVVACTVVEYFAYRILRRRGMLVVRP